MRFDLWRICPTNDFGGSGSGKGAGIPLTRVININLREIRAE